MAKTTDAREIDDRALTERVNALIARGLERYGDGDLVGALSEWEHARALSPHAEAPPSYIEYVRANFELLEEQFEEARRAALVAAEAGLPIEQVGVGGEAAGDDDAPYAEISVDGYDQFDIDMGDDEPRPTRTTRSWPPLKGEGWPLDELAPASPLPPVPDALDSPGLDIIAEGLAAIAGGQLGDGRAELAADAALRIPAGAPLARGIAPRGKHGGAGRPPAADAAEYEELTLDDDDDSDGEPTRSSGPAGADAARTTAESATGAAAPLGDPPERGLSLEFGAAGGPVGFVADADLGSAPGLAPGARNAQTRALDDDDGIELAPAGRRAARMDRDVTPIPDGSEDFSLSIDFDAHQRAVPDGSASADPELERTVPGGDEPPPLPERPSLTRDALAELGRAVGAASAAGDPSVRAASALDESGFDDLEEPGDDRANEAGSGHDVRVSFRQGGTREHTVPAKPAAAARLRGAPGLGGRAPLRADAFGHTPAGSGDTEDGEDGEDTGEHIARARAWDELDDHALDDGFGLGHDLHLDDDERDDDVQTRDRELPTRGRAPTEDGALAGIIADSLFVPPGEDDLTRERLAIRDEVPEPEPYERGHRVPARFDPADDADDDEVLDGFGGSAKDQAVSARGLAVRDPWPHDRVAIQIDAEIDVGAPADEDPGERTRRRVTALLDRAAAEHATGRHPLAVTALDLALDEAPDSAIAQRIIQGRRSRLIGMYEDYLGDRRAIPTVCLPSHELSQQRLDSRAAFLLSRIDGMLTFEEVLDVAGMGELEAYRHLCRLLLRGILEVR